MAELVNIAHILWQDTEAAVGGEVCKKTVLGPQRMIDCHAPERQIHAVARIDHGLVLQQAEQRLPIRHPVFLQARNQVAQVQQIQHVGIGVVGVIARILIHAAEGFCPAHSLAELGPAVREGVLPDLAEEAVCLLGQPVGLAQINARQGQVVSAFPLFVPVKKTVDDPSAGFGPVPVLLGVLQEAVVPAAARLGLLRGDEILSKRREHNRHLERCHQAGIKTQPSEFLPGEGAVAHSRSQLGQTQRVAGGLILTDTPDRPAAVIPDDECIVFRRETARTVAEQHRQRARLAHVHACPGLPEAGDAVRPHGIDPGSRAVDVLQMPGFGAARHQQHVDLFRIVAGPDDLPDIPAGRALGRAFKVAAAHIDHDRQVFPLCRLFQLLFGARRTVWNCGALVGRLIALLHIAQQTAESAPLFGKCRKRQRKNKRCRQQSRENLLHIVTTHSRTGRPAASDR